MYAIYALVDPRDRTTRSVGTTGDVYARLCQHICCDGSNFRKDEQKEGCSSWNAGKKR